MGGGEAEVHPFQLRKTERLQRFNLQLIEHNLRRVHRVRPAILSLHLACEHLCARDLSATDRFSVSMASNAAVIAAHIGW